jgi:replication-associated recombination protein RarA
MYQPLADLLRPTTLDDVFGQEHILGKGAVLRRLIDSGKVPNMIFYGPPGTGKTTAASVIAKVTRDRMMKDLALQYPEYELEKHKGYPTKEHYRKILQHGIAPIYRKSFLKNLDQHRED